MTISYFTHVRCLGDGSSENPYRSSLEFLPEIDALLMFINHRAACVDLNQKPIDENMGKDRWSNIRIIARNRHIAVITTESEDSDFENQINSFTEWRPTRPYGFDFESYIQNVSDHRNWLINNLKNIDELFDETAILSYILKLNFDDSDYQSIKNWIVSILNGGNDIYPDVLSQNNLWLFKGLNRFYDKWSLEGIYSDINKMFNAFEIYNMDCILEVI
jgi:hypothetical protein